MPHLEITTLGTFQARLDGLRLGALNMDKVRALLVFLVVEACRPHRREGLAGMFWPERPTTAARNNLRQVLYRLREAIGEQGLGTSFLQVTYSDIQFDPGSDYWLDVKQFSSHLDAHRAHHPGRLSLCKSCLDELRAAVALYGGDFLAGFSLPDCPQFDWWLLFQQEYYHHQALEALACLGSYYEGAADYRQASIYAQKEIELEPWRETAHQRRMRSLALSGERSAALRQYESCRAILAEEMGIEPSKATTDLYELIRLGGAPQLEEAIQPGVDSGVPSQTLLRISPSTVPFVGFESELAQLEVHLATALSGHARVACLSGEAGSGKTTLLAEFMRRVMGAHSDLLAVAGNCNAQFGYGDPYLPFRQILQLLTGNLESAGSVGVLGEEHAGRIRSAHPVVLEALLKEGSDMIDSLLPLEALLRHVHNLGDEARGAVARLEAQAWRRAGEESTPGSLSRQIAFFDEFTRVLLAIARRYPLILAVDDLHWADRGTLSLFFHLARNLGEGRVLVIGAYRPEEITLDRSGERHPMQSIVNELLAQYGEVRVDLSQAAGWDFVIALLDSEPNVLDEGFRRGLFQLTEGHPLFTVEQLRGMQESGGLVQDDAGRWTAGEKLDWERIPARVEAVIAERLARPSAECRSILEAASVQGETFSAETLAIVLGETETRIIKHLSSELCSQHCLVFAESQQQLGDTTRSRYRFRHTLYQHQLYQSLDPVRKARLHLATGEALERCYAQEAGGMTLAEASAASLAFHFEQAGLVEKAIRYHQIAGEQAYQLAANEDAISHYNRALELLKSISESSEKIRQKLLLLLSLSGALIAAGGYAEPELRQIYAQAGELATKGNEVDLFSHVLYLRGIYHYARAEYQSVLEMGEQLLRIALDRSTPWMADIANFLIGISRLNNGELTLAQAHLQKIKAVGDSDQVNFTISPIDRDRLVFSIFFSWTVWLLGYPDQALELNQQLLYKVRKMGYPYYLASTLGMCSCVIHAFCGEIEELQKRAKELIDLSREKGFGLYQAWGKFFLGKAQVKQGDIDAGLDNMQIGLWEYRAMGHRSALTILLAFQTEAYAAAGQYEQALESLSEAFRLADETGERLYEAELHRLRGELLLETSGEEDEAEYCIQKSLQVAREQGARSLELRAATSLTKLWSRQGKANQISQILVADSGDPALKRQTI